MTARKCTRSSWARLLAVLILMWMIFVPMAAVAGGEDDPGVTGMGGTESAMPPPEDEQSTEWHKQRPVL